MTPYRSRTKKRVLAKASNPPVPAPATLTMRLFAPGMSLLHRAGLGGLACTLKAIERAWSRGDLGDDQLPAGPWRDDEPPWQITRHAVRLDFGDPLGAGPYLRRLFALAFQIKDGVIYLPGQYGREPSLAIRAELQNGLMLTFLQHGKVRVLSRQPSVVPLEPMGGKNLRPRVEFKRCESFKHQQGWTTLVDTAERLTSRPIEINGPLSPGAVVRHVAFARQTKIVNAVELALPLYFAIVAALALPVNRGVGSLVVPDVDDLCEFSAARPRLTPRSLRECRAAAGADAVMQAKVRFRDGITPRPAAFPEFVGWTFSPTAWACQQKSRTWTSPSRGDPGSARLEPDDRVEETRRLDQFELALALFAPRIRVGAEKVQTDQGCPEAETTRPYAYWVDSVVRPLVADNLAAGKAWYTDFTRLMRDRDAQGNPYRHRLRFESEALRKMTEFVEFEFPRERAFVEAVQNAIQIRLRQIKRDTQRDDTGRSTPATDQRRHRFREELRLALVAARTQDQCRSAICELFGKAGQNSVLQDRWQEILPLFVDEKQWQKARDLALLALASLRSVEAEGVRVSETTEY